MKLTKPFNNVSSTCLRLTLPSIKGLSQLTFKRLSKRACSKENAAVNNTAESLNVYRWQDYRVQMQIGGSTGMELTLLMSPLQ